MKEQADEAYYGTEAGLQDTEEAIRVYKLAIAHGSVEAEYQLGSFVDALVMEKQLIEELKATGSQVFGGH